MIANPGRAVLLIALVGSTTTASDIAQDLHLHPVLRTAEEARRIVAATAPTVPYGTLSRYETLPAGAATVPARLDDRAFSSPSASLPDGRLLDFELGNALFDKLWVSSPSSTLASDGLGPLYNARSCAGCHINDGRGHPPLEDAPLSVSLVLKVGVPNARGPADADADPGYGPDAVYGGQIQTSGLPGHAGEAQLRITYEEIEVPLKGAPPVRLRKPLYHADEPAYGPFHPRAVLSPRIAPQMIGLGLLEAIPAADILAGEDPFDRDGDGISGRANVVWSEEHGAPMLGRFGLKAAAPTVREQTAAAFSKDIGISTSMFPAPWGDCTAAQTSCRRAPHGDSDARVFEVDDIALDLVTHYARNLAVPARRAADDPEVLRGKAVFHETGCQSCHRPAYVTHRLPDRPEHSFQLIWPYTDMLLHDMGEGLADGLPEALADGREWRTPPLWGIGLTRQVSGHTRFLHDGRAGSLLEAILWHGGEAQSHSDAVAAMRPADRAALIRFLESL